MPKNGLLIIGIILAVLGAAALAYGGFTYREKETIVDVGPVKVTGESDKSVPIPPIVGGVTLAVGAVCIVMGIKKP